MPLTRERLDYMASTVYATGDPRPDPDAEPIVLQSRCHTAAPAVLWLGVTDLILTIACWECLKPIAPVSLASLPSRPLLCFECGDGPVWASYRHATGRLEIACASCGRTIAKLAVLSHAN